jgi:hypothetical protein
MNDRQRAALDRAAEFAQERSRPNWNRVVEAEEQVLRDAEAEAQERRSQFHVVSDEN